MDLKRPSPLCDLISQEVALVIRMDDPGRPSSVDENTPELKLPIKNFRAVTPFLYRGGQPTAKQFEELKAAGIKTIICLRWNSISLKQERTVAAKLGFNLFCLPLSYWIMPTRAEINRFFSVVDNPENHPVFVHCLHGSDRTGMLTAMYRIARENWTFDEAYREMVACGFHRLTVYHMKWAVYRFAERLKRAGSASQPSA
jgi:protein tyrosine/serine phosphatase